jgi:hypothetical protein
MASDPYNIEYPQDLSGNAHSPLGMNLMKNVSYASGWAFVDGWKPARQWISQKPGMGWGEGGPLDLDENGWVRSLLEGQIARTLLLLDLSGHYPAGRYIVLYDGQGTIEYRGAAQKDIAASRQRRDVIEVDPFREGCYPHPDPYH